MTWWCDVLRWVERRRFELRWGQAANRCAGEMTLWSEALEMSPLLDALRANGVGVSVTWCESFTMEGFDE